ncbi:energy transducer TonB [Sphingomonas yabuuchiae]|uniref:energy transducer TonB n=1 Tax=Sphingomonas yabuuchiae TaxID=172044 RepID=UPI003D996BE7
MAMWALGLMMLGQGVPGQAADAPRPELVGDIAVVFGPDHYPPAAIRAREQGRVVVDLAVDRQGRVTDCRVIEAAAASLAEQTCRLAVSSPGLFRAARDRRGATVPSHYQLRIRWQLPDDDEAPDAGMAPGHLMPAAMTVTVEPDGRVVSCEGGLPNQSRALPLDHAVCTEFARQTVAAFVRHNRKPPAQRLEGRFVMDYALSPTTHGIPAWPRDIVLLNDMSIRYTVTPDQKRVNCKSEVRLWDEGIPKLAPCKDAAAIPVDPSWPVVDALFRMGYRVIGRD